MNCPHCRAAEQKFGPAVAQGDLRQYRHHRLNPTTQRILSVLREMAPDRTTLLDIGAGIGVITHELLAGGTRTATLVDASSSYLDAARAEAQARGHADRIRFVHGDFVDRAREVPSADVVTLDRVVCCYPDYRALLELSAAKCGRAYAISYPRDRWFVRLTFAVENFLRRLRRDAFRTYVHSEAEIRQVLVTSGLKPVGGSTSPVWRVELYLRGPISDRPGRAS